MTIVDPYRPPEVRVDDPVPTGQKPLARRATRLVARILDNLLYFGPMIVIGFLLGGLDFRDPSDDRGFLIMLIPIPIVFAINVVLLVQNGQTIGKKVLNIKIVRQNFDVAGFGRILVLRMLAPSMVSVIPYIGTVFGLTNALFIFRADRRCIHDWMADTVVVET